MYYTNLASFPRNNVPYFKKKMFCAPDQYLVLEKIDAFTFDIQGLFTCICIEFDMLC